MAQVVEEDLAQVAVSSAAVLNLGLGLARMWTSPQSFDMQ